MNVRIKKQVSRFYKDKDSWCVQIWCWYWPFWRTIESALEYAVAMQYANDLLNPTIVRVV